MRKKATFHVLFVFLCLCLQQIAIAQSQTYVQGTVKDEKGNPLGGASVSEKDRSANGTLTDSLGRFLLVLKGKSNEVIINYVGYEEQTVKAGSGTVSFILKPSKGNTNNEVVVIGYQNQKRHNVTSAIASISGKDIENLPSASFDQLLQGRLAGVSVQSPTGAPGAKPNIVIRGSTNLDYANANGGNTGPLYVIDGVIFDVNNMESASATGNPLTLINPNDIESIDVLKDASAAAIYGARGGNGVIIVRTKRARKNSRPQVDVSGYGGATIRPNLREVETGTFERELKLSLLHDQLPYADWQSGTVPQALTDSLNPAFNNDVDWQGLIMRDVAITNNQDLSVAGYFTGNNSYRLALNHYSEQGAVKGFSLERLSPVLNLNLNPIRRLSVNANLILSFEKRNHGAGVDFYNPYLFNTYNFPTSFAQLDPSALAIYNGTSTRFDDNTIFSYNANVQLTDTLTRDLLITTSYGANNAIDKYAYFSPKELNGVQNTAYDNENNNPNWNWETYAQYVKSIKNNHFVLVGGYSTYKAQRYYGSSYAAGINVSGIYTLQTVPSGSNLFTYTGKEIKTTQSYYGRLSYDYDGKYLLTASLRRDASSIYSPQYRWGTFSSVSGGWILSDEKFFTPLKKVVSFLKLRASYGVTGQDPGGWYSKYQTLYADASYSGATTGSIGGNTYYSYLGGVPSTYNGTTVITPFGYGNGFVTYATKSSDDVHWERYPQIDIGGDMNLFNNRVNVTVDWYQKDAKDKYLWLVPAESTTGYQYYSGNLADIRNRGLEFVINTQNFSPKSAFQWSTSFNIAFNHNWITKLPNGGRDLLFGESYFRKTLSLGSPLFSYKLYQTDGVYATDADVPVDPITGTRLTYFGTPLQAGDSKIIDQNGDYNIDLEDQVANGKSPSPTCTGGLQNTFTYKGISLQVFASYSFGNSILNGSLSDNLNGSARYASWGAVAGPAGFTDILNKFWQQSGDQTIYPRLIYPISQDPGVTDPWNISRSYFLEDGGFIKLKQVTLGYTFPASFTNRIKLRNLYVYGTGANLWMWKQAKDIADPELYDPTTGSVNIIYPTALKFIFGVQVGF